MLWTLVAAGTLLEAGAALTFAVAAFSDPLPRGAADYAPNGSTEVLGRPLSLHWSTDRLLLVAAAAFALAGVMAFVLAARRFARLDRR